MADKIHELRALAAAAALAHRSLETGIARVDGAWNDSARRTFEANHLAAIRGDARHLRDELDEIAQLADQAARQLADRH